MSDSDLGVTPPDPRAGGARAVARIVLEMAAQSFPVTAALAHLYRYTHPSQFERALQQFWRDVAAKLTDHEARLDALEQFLAPRAALGPQAMELVLHMLRANESGRREPVKFEELATALPHIERGRLEEAAAELAAYRYATLARALGHPVRNVCLTSDAFLAFDRAATGHDTRADAICIAKLWLENTALASVSQLMTHLGWEPRRLNPPLAALQHVFPDGRWSKAIHPTLEVVSVLITNEERFLLRRIVDSGRLDLEDLPGARGAA